MRQVGLWLVVLCLSSCISRTRHAEVELVDQQDYSVVSDSIYSRMPGNIFYQDDILYWQDAFSPEGFIHAIDAVTHQELCSFGAMGDGPGEFSFPLLSLSPSSGFLINDGTKKLETLYRIDRDADSLSVTSREYENRQDATRFFYLSNGDKFYLCPDASQPFYVKSATGEGHYEGVFPVEEKVTNGFDVFQGNLAYNPKKETVVYSSFSFPYLAVYSVHKGEVKLKAASKSPLAYTLSDGELRPDPNERGGMELGMTKHYVVTLQRDKQVEGEAPQARSGRDLSTLPRSLVLYDYDLNLKKIIRMPFPMLRICGDTDSDAIYAIAVNPEFMLIKIDLAD